MMLVAIDEANGSRIDVTTLTRCELDEYHGQRVARSHGHAPTCQDCNRAVHLVRDHHRHVYFRHNPGEAAGCLRTEVTNHSGGESPEHIETKLRIIAAVRSLKGWIAKPEDRHVVDGEAIKADVSAIYVGNKPTHDWQGRFAWEVQLSHQTEGEFHERSRRIKHASGLTALWLTPHQKAVPEHTPSMICAPDGSTIVDRFLTQYSPEHIAAPPTDVGDVLRSVHRKHPGHGWHHIGGDAPGYYVIHKDAYLTGPIPERRTAAVAPRADDELEHSPCYRPPLEPVAEQWCCTCGAPIAAPWGFTFDAPMCRDCFNSKYQGIDIEGRARMAAARAHAGLTLNDIDRQALHAHHQQEPQCPNQPEPQPAD